jgi:hypothetical protein
MGDPVGAVAPRGTSRQRRGDAGTLGVVPSRNLIEVKPWLADQA